MIRDPPFLAAVLAFYILNGALPLRDQAPFYNTGLFAVLTRNYLSRKAQNC